MRAIYFIPFRINGSDVASKLFYREQHRADSTQISSAKAMDIMQSFTYDAAPMRILFGSGKLNDLSEEISRQRLSAPLLLRPCFCQHHSNLTT
jgi:hypothetical protein